MLNQAAIDFDKAVSEEFGDFMNPRGMVQWYKPTTDFPEGGYHLTVTFFAEGTKYREDLTVGKRSWEQMGPEAAAQVLSDLVSGAIRENRLRKAE